MYTDIYQQGNDLPKIQTRYLVYIHDTWLRITEIDTTNLNLKISKHPRQTVIIFEAGTRATGHFRPTEHKEAIKSICSRASIQCHTHPPTRTPLGITHQVWLRLVLEDVRPKEKAQGSINFWYIIVWVQRRQNWVSIFYVVLYRSALTIVCMLWKYVNIPEVIY